MDFTNSYFCYNNSRGKQKVYLLIPSLYLSIVTIVRANVRHNNQQTATTYEKKKGEKEEVRLPAIGGATLLAEEGAEEGRIHVVNHLLTGGEF